MLAEFGPCNHNIKSQIQSPVPSPDLPSARRDMPWHEIDHLGWPRFVLRASSALFEILLSTF